MFGIDKYPCNVLLYERIRVSFLVCRRRVKNIHLVTLVFINRLDTFKLGVILGRTFEFNFKESD